jgi:hypothetical protein
MERKYFWVHLIVAFTLCIFITGFYNAVLGVVSAMTYYLFIWLIELYRETAGDYQELLQKHITLKTRLDALEDRVANIEIPKRGKPRVKPSDALSGLGPERIARATRKTISPGERVDYGSVYRQDNETEEQFKTRVKMEMSTVSQPNIQDLD